MTSAAAAASAPGTAFSAVPDAIGAQDVSGPYEVVEGWPQIFDEQGTYLSEWKIAVSPSIR